MTTVCSSDPREITEPAGNGRAGWFPTSGTDSITPVALRFVRVHSLKLVIISAAVLAPCFWHREIEAADLGSHLYNAWLAQLIHHGQAPGLSIAHQWTNVLFDYMLSGFGALFGFYAAEKLAVAIAVLIFFWGVFALAAAAARRAPWFLAPVLAIFTYGYTFHMGFFNYYLSLGLSFFGIAIFWRGARRARWLVLALVPFILPGHPLGLVWLAAACIWIALAEKLRPRHHAVLIFAAVALLIAAHFWFWAHYVVYPHPGHFYRANGTDQMLLFGAKYRLAQCALIVFAACALLLDLWRRRESLREYVIPFELYLVIWIASLTLPDLVYLPHQAAPISILTARLTSVSAALLCCVLAAMRPRRWHLAASLIIAVLFFGCMFHDTGRINRIEARADALLQSIPPGSRVVGKILSPEGGQIPIQHILDRGCIGHCFSYGNYEPGSRMFRVRAAPGNPIVLADYSRALETESGEYVVKEGDMPIWGLYQCDSTGRRLCLVPLKAGERNGHLAVYIRRP